MMKKALIFHGGWQGHEPKLVSKRFANLLKKEDFEVFVYDTLECLGDKDFLLSMDLIIPMWTQGELDDRYAFSCQRLSNLGLGLQVLMAACATPSAGQLSINS